MGRLRILMLGYEFPPVGGGGGKAMARLARDAVAAGHRVHVMTTAYQRLPRSERSGGASVQRIPALRRRPDRCTTLEMASFALSSTLAVLHAARAFRPDLIHVFFGIPSGPGALLLHRMTGQLYIVSTRGSDVPRPEISHLAWLYRLSRPYLRTLWTNAAAVVAVSDDLREAIWRTLPEIEVQVIPNGVDADRFHPARVKRNGPVRLLAVGRLQYFKGFQDLLVALSTLPAGIPDWHLRIVGDGPYRLELERLTSRLQLGARVQQVPWIEHERMPGVYRDADIVVSPSAVEGLPNAVLEAMASGVPVIATDVPGNRQLVRNDVSGSLIPAADTQALASAVERLLCDSALRVRLGQAARELVLRDYAWTQVNQAYLQLYDRVLGRAGLTFAGV